MNGSPAERPDARRANRSGWLALSLLLTGSRLFAAVSEDPEAALERTCFQTGQAYGDSLDSRSDVAIVYGIDGRMPNRVASWRDHGYRVHLMTGVSWGNYQDYLYGRFDGTNHEDEAQTERRGQKVSHGGDVYYMCPGENYGKFLCVGVQRALDAKVEAIHLEEPEFWVRSGYSEGFKREWQTYYHEPWQPPHGSVDAQWRASKLKYYLYRRALQQVFDYVTDWNRRTGASVRCYVPSHSLLNYAQWRIVSPESSLARLTGCDGYIAQVWTGTARTPNLFRGQLRERTFETAYCEYGAMQNLVRATGRTVWYLHDPVEDNPNHDWGDYRRNWEATVVASLLQPDVWRYEVMPWPERVWRGQYPSTDGSGKRVPMPAEYALELQTVINALNDMRQPAPTWDCGTRGVGVLVSDSLMFERGDPSPSDAHLSDFYGLALPLLKRGMPVQPVQLENVTIPQYLAAFNLLLMSYHGMKPLDPEVHQPLADWVKDGGVLAFFDDDSDPFNHVREWWNTNANSQLPRQHLFQKLGLDPLTKPGLYHVGKGIVLFRSESPSALAKQPDGDSILASELRAACSGTRAAWKETNSLLLRRGPYVIAAGLDEAPEHMVKSLTGRFVDLFDPELRVKESVSLLPGERRFLLDLSALPGNGADLLASACKAIKRERDAHSFQCTIEGVAETPSIVLLRLPATPKIVTLDGTPLPIAQHEPGTGLTWLKFQNEARPRILRVEFDPLREQ